MTKGTIIRIAILLLTLANLILVNYGLSPLPISEEHLELLVSTVITVVVALWTAWKNNDITKKAIARKELADKLLKANKEFNKTNS